MESYARWEPVADVFAPCGRVVLHADPAAVVARVVFSEVRDAPPRDLLLTFGRDVIACMSHEEFAHPWQTDDTAGPVPRLGPPWAQYAFPLLVVRDSRWLASFADHQVDDERRGATTHYRLVSLDDTVDVLTTGPVAAQWVVPAI